MTGQDRFLLTLNVYMVTGLGICTLLSEFNIKLDWNWQFGLLVLIFGSQILWDYVKAPLTNIVKRLILLVKKEA